MANKEQNKNPNQKKEAKMTLKEKRAKRLKRRSPKSF
jgi:hypothetical protein